MQDQEGSGRFCDPNCHQGSSGVGLGLAYLSDQDGAGSSLSSARVPGFFSDFSTEPMECFTSSTVMPPVVSLHSVWRLSWWTWVKTSLAVALGCQLPCCQQNLWG